MSSDAPGIELATKCFLSIPVFSAHELRPTTVIDRAIVKPKKMNLGKRRYIVVADGSKKKTRFRFRRNEPGGLVGFTNIYLDIIQIFVVSAPIPS